MTQTDRLKLLPTCRLNANFLLRVGTGERSGELFNYFRACRLGRISKSRNKKSCVKRNTLTVTLWATDQIQRGTLFPLIFRTIWSHVPTHRQYKNYFYFTSRTFFKNNFMAQLIWHIGKSRKSSHIQNLPKSQFFICFKRRFYFIETSKIFIVCSNYKYAI